jgi:hypothetical protein
VHLTGKSAGTRPREPALGGRNLLNTIDLLYFIG